MTRSPLPIRVREFYDTAAVPSYRVMIMGTSVFLCHAEHLNYCIDRALAEYRGNPFSDRGWTRTVNDMRGLTVFSRMPVNWTDANKLLAAEYKMDHDTFTHEYTQEFKPATCEEFEAECKKRGLDPLTGKPLPDDYKTLAKPTRAR